MKKQIMKKQSMKNQQGMTMISWIVVLAFIGFQIMVAIKVLPVFAEDHTIKQVWHKIENDTDLVGVSPKKIRKAIKKHLRINNIYNYDLTNLKIKRDKGYYKVTLLSEPRGNIVGKLDFIVSFNYEAKVKAR